MSGFELVTKVKWNQVTVKEVTDEEARRLLTGHVRDVSGMMASLKSKPYAKSLCEGGELRYKPLGS